MAVFFKIAVFKKEKKNLLCTYLFYFFFFQRTLFKKYSCFDAAIFKCALIFLKIRIVILKIQLIFKVQLF